MRCTKDASSGLAGEVQKVAPSGGFASLSVRAQGVERKTQRKKRKNVK